MLIVLDNAESILDPQGANGREIHAVVEELSQFTNICLCITSRITIVPPDCETLEIPTLSMEAARAAFYRIYKYGTQSDSVNNILEQLDFHPLSVTLLATVAHQNKWDNNRLVREWKQRQTGVLQTGSGGSLAHTIELSLASPMFIDLGADARGLLEVVAFFPQGIDENNLEWLFPDIPNRTTVFDTFCVLSLTYRTNGFVAMLAPLRDHLRPRDPTSSPVLCATKDRYFTRMSPKLVRNTPAFREAQWIVSEDANVEYLLDVFTADDVNTSKTWKACADFIQHLRFHKPRHTLLKPKIEGLPDENQSKAECLFYLGELLSSVGNYVEAKRLLELSLNLVREWGDDHWAAWTLRGLADVNRMLNLYKEGIQQAREALEIYQRLGSTVEQARSFVYLGWLLWGDSQPDAAKEAASRAIGLLPEKGQELQLCQSHRLLGLVYRSKGERAEAIHHFEAAVEIATPFNWNDQIFWIYYSLTGLFHGEGELEIAHTHIEQAKSHAVNDAYNLGRAMELQSKIWFAQRRFDEAKSEALSASEALENLGAVRDSERCIALLRLIEQEMENQPSDSSSSHGGHSSGMFFPIRVDSPFSAHGTSASSATSA